MALTVGNRRALLFAQPPAVSPYDPDATAYFARMSTQEPDAFKVVVSAFVTGLKADGVWALIDRLGLFATTTEANALFDLKQTTKIFARGGTTTFTTQRGIAGDGTTGYVDFTEAANGAGNAWTDTSASFAIYCNLTDNVGASRVPHFGGVAASRSTYYAHGSGSENARINQTADSTGVRASVTRLGHRAGSRTAAAVIRYYFNGAFTTAFTAANTTTSTTFPAIGRDGTAFCNDRFPAVMTGQGMSDTQMTAYHTRLNTLLTALGAA